ncbi:hypothetical protein [Hyalangium gracile]|uniref:hypothetical protein n=1 Tax=Hyalangium gracile TaxID=394092 RepID=UPI001CC91752|nr:hypothetical protein [Hyalangium gracile]
MSPPSVGSSTQAPPAREAEEPVPPAEPNSHQAASLALTVSIIAAFTAPVWVVAGLFLDSLAFLLAGIPGIVSLVLSLRALMLTYRRPGGRKRSLVSLGLGALAFVIALLSSGLGLAFIQSQMRGVEGRALRIRGRPVTADGAPEDAWSGDEAPEASSSDAESREVLAAEWEADAKSEHASIASFTRLSLDLMAEGAPPHLIEACLRAALDEVRHARGAYSLASGYAGRSRGPGPLPEVATAPGGLSRLAMETLIDGCFGEGLAAARAREAAAEARDPAVRAHLSAVAREESDHAELAWDVLAFCLERGGVPARLATERALEICARGVQPVSNSSRPLDGRLSPERIAALSVTVQREVEARVRRMCGVASVPAESSSWL